MSISIKPENEAFLKRLVADGAYASIDEAADAAIATLRVHEDNDLSWAGPYIDQGIASLERGEGLSHDEVFSQVREHIESHRS